MEVVLLDKFPLYHGLPTFDRSGSIRYRTNVGTWRAMSG